MKITQAPAVPAPFRPITVVIDTPEMAGIIAALIGPTSPRSRLIKGADRYPTLLSKPGQHEGVTDELSQLFFLCDEAAQTASA